MMMLADEQAIRELNAGWIEAVNAGDLGRLLTMMAEDVVFLNPGGAPVGREGFEAVFLGAHKQNQIRCESEVVEVVVVGEVAYSVCRDSLTMMPRGGDEGAEFAGHRLTVWRKQGDGRWMLARDAHTLGVVERRGA